MATDEWLQTNDYRFHQSNSDPFRQIQHDQGGNGCNGQKEVHNTRCQNDFKRYPANIPSQVSMK